MAWGDSASYDKMPCPWCGAEMVDDRSNWPTTHMQECQRATFWNRLKGWLRYGWYLRARKEGHGKGR